MSETTDRVSQLLRARLEEIGQEAAGIERALAGLGGVTGGGHRSGGGSPQRRVGRRPRRAKRAARGERQAQLLAAIKAHPTAGPSALAETIGVKPPQVYALLAKLRSERLISKQGKGYSVKAAAAKKARGRSKTVA
jgi:hypothetical protein